jgi:hypothetical protein
MFVCGLVSNPKLIDNFCFQFFFTANCRKASLVVRTDSAATCRMIDFWATDSVPNLIDIRSLPLGIWYVD